MYSPAGSWCVDSMPKYDDELTDTFPVCCHEPAAIFTIIPRPPFTLLMTYILASASTINTQLVSSGQLKNTS